MITFFGILGAIFTGIGVILGVIKKGKDEKRRENEWQNFLKKKSAELGTEESDEESEEEA